MIRLFETVVKRRILAALDRPHDPFGLPLALLAHLRDRKHISLIDVGAHIFGVVLNNVKLETQDYYYTGYYSNYYYSNVPDEEVEAQESTSGPTAQAQRSVE